MKTLITHYFDFNNSEDLIEYDLYSHFIPKNLGNSDIKDAPSSFIESWKLPTIVIQLKCYKIDINKKGGVKI